MERSQLATGALALGGGFLVAISLPPWGFWPLAIAGVMAFETALGSTPAPRRRFVLGALFGAGWLAMGTGWMWQLTIPGYVVAAVVFAALHGCAALVAPTGVWRVIGRPAAHALVEALRFSFPFGGVPLASLGISQVGGPLAGLARVIGVIGITWAVFQIGCALAGPSPVVPAFVHRFRRGAHGVPHGVIAFGAVVVLLVVSAFAPRGDDTGGTLTIAAVQGGGQQGTSALEVPSLVVTERHLEATATIPADGEIDMVLWPENVIRVRDVPFEQSDLFDQVAAEAGRLGVPFVVGITEDADVTGRGQPGQVTNAQVVVTPEGEVTSRYDKVRRVPFGEYVPLRGLLETLGAPVDQVSTDAVAGTDPAVVFLPDGTPLAVAISWEIFFPGRVREGVEAGGQLVVNPTNGASYTGTIVQTQQVASSRLRAIETGRWVVQAAPTGFSAVISPSGVVVERTAVSEQRTITAEIPLRTGSTWYVRLGEAPIIGAVVALFAASHLVPVAASRRRRRQLDEQGDRAVVDERDPHVGPEPTGGHRGTSPA